MAGEVDDRGKTEVAGRHRAVCSRKHGPGICDGAAQVEMSSGVARLRHLDATSMPDDRPRAMCNDLQKWSHPKRSAATSTA